MTLGLEQRRTTTWIWFTFRCWRSTDKSGSVLLTSDDVCEGNRVGSKLGYLKIKPRTDMRQYTAASRDTRKLRC